MAKERWTVLTFTQSLGSNRPVLDVGSTLSIKVETTWDEYKGGVFSNNDD
ncbi:hypothetical protein N9850_02420 [Granulosicoccus sp.]|nr:hypothetical protein [Granulosicoccus sp.]MDB4222600.1 hypothetical protein [Granulosicoccus sp.]